MSEKREIICTTCRIKFTSVMDYKLHLLTEFHVYNTKRRMADLAPISEEVFNQKRDEMISANASAITEVGYKCLACNKTFKSKEKLEEHMKTKKHKKNMKEYLAAHPNESAIQSYSHNPMGSIASSDLPATGNILDELKTLNSGKSNVYPDLPMQSPWPPSPS